MEKILEMYGYNPTKEEVAKKLASIVKDASKLMTPSNLDKCLSYMDLTTLNTTDTEARVIKFAENVNEFKKSFPNYSTPASICIYPNLGKAVKDNLKVPGVNVTVVAGVFPNSQSFLEVKLLECKLACENGADEIDIVLALNKFLAGDYQGAANEIIEIKKVIGDKHLKVILETGALDTPAKIAAASFLSMEAGADFIKTSTGKMEPAATPEAAIVMCEAIKAYYKETGKKIGFKPAGGMVTSLDAIIYFAIVNDILGDEWLNPELFRLGASRLANNILSDLEQTNVSYY